MTVQGKEPESRRGTFIVQKRKPEAHKPRDIESVFDCERKPYQKDTSREVEHIYHL